jgi:hypothetical protein
VVQQINSGADHSADEIEFMMAMDHYKRERGRPYPTWCEVLAVLKGLGYRKAGNVPHAPGESGTGTPGGVTG